jgi:DNA-binding transcriptional ArsR family regulator
MVERFSQLDRVFTSLSDPTRRDMLRRIGKKSMNIGEIAQHYTISFAAVAKHISVLEGADLVTKTRHGKERVVSLTPATFAAATHYLDQYREMWEQRLDSLDNLLKKTKTKGQQNAAD